MSVIGGGRIVDPLESIIAVQASDDPTGVLSLEQAPQGMVVNEGDVLVVGVVRRAGTSGTVTLTWDITPPDGTVFATVSDTIVLIDGQSQENITIQVHMTGMLSGGAINLHALDLLNVLLVLGIGV